MPAIKILFGALALFLSFHAVVILIGVADGLFWSRTQDGEVLTIDILLLFLAFGVLPAVICGVVVAIFNFYFRTVRSVWAIGLGAAVLYGVVTVARDVDVEAIKGQLVVAFILNPGIAAFSSALSNKALRAWFDRAPGQR